MTRIAHVTPENSARNSRAVSLREISKTFGTFTAVNRVSLDVQQGEIFGFLGPNGAGKSTTIRMLCGILSPSSGTGAVAGFDIVRHAEEIKAAIGYMSQKFSLYEDLTVEENIDFYSGIYRIAPQRKRDRKEWVIAMAGLQSHRTAAAGTLSTGWKQRLALGCAILHEPPIIFLDEPTAGVDPVSRRSFWDLIYHLADHGTTVFVTTHYLDEAEYCDRLGLIYQGELIANGTPEALKSSALEEDVIQISCDRPHEAMAAMGDLAGVRHAALFGAGLHVVVADAAAAMPAMAAALGRLKISLCSMSTIEPSLEDVFVSLIETRDRAKPASGTSAP